MGSGLSASADMRTSSSWSERALMGTHILDESSVWGILYNMAHEDEAVLDQYEGHGVARNPNPVPHPDLTTLHRKPYLQDAPVGVASVGVGPIISSTYRSQ